MPIPFDGKMKLQLYDKTKIKWDDLKYPSKALRMLLIPVVIEQLLNSLMGIADTMMVSQVGSTAMSAVSLVDAINVLLIQVFAALATGATIICAQYLGQKNEKKSNQAASQIFFTILVISVVTTILCLLFRLPLMDLLFGDVEPELMEDCLTYFFITALSFPFIALFQVGAAFYRAGNNSKFPMRVSVISNLLNVGGNAILIFGFGMGVAGAAVSTLISRIFCMLVVFIRLRKPNQAIVLRRYIGIRPDLPMILRILAIGVPAGIENGMFQFGKLAIQSSVSTLPTHAIAAQAMAIILENLNGIAAIGIGIGLMTIVGQTLGAGRREEARYYIVKLTEIAEIVVIVSCLLVLALTWPIMHLAGMEPESCRLCWEMILAITIVKPFAWVPAFIPAYGMRAAGDVKYSMIVSSLVMWFCRVALCIYLIRCQGFGPIAVWIGMFADWTLRAVIFSRRYLSGRWLSHEVIADNE